MQQTVTTRHCRRAAPGHRRGRRQGQSSCASDGAARARCPAGALHQRRLRVLLERCQGSRARAAANWPWTGSCRAAGATMRPCPPRRQPRRALARLEALGQPSPRPGGRPLSKPAARWQLGARQAAWWRRWHCPRPVGLQVEHARRIGAGVAIGVDGHRHVCRDGGHLARPSTDRLPTTTYSRWPHSPVPPAAAGTALPDSRSGPQPGRSEGRVLAHGPAPALGIGTHALHQVRPAAPARHASVRCNRRCTAGAPANGRPRAAPHRCACAARRIGAQQRDAQLLVRHQPPEFDLLLG